jgi:hypothetical protein
MKEIFFKIRELILIISDQLDSQPIREGEMSMEPDFLMEIMDLNEEIIEADDRFLSRLTAFFVSLLSYLY